MRSTNVAISLSLLLGSAPSLVGQAQRSIILGQVTDRTGTANRAASAILRAAQRLDAFVSLTADFTAGELTTPLLRFEGNRLRLNIDTSAEGEAAVELLDAASQPIPGFSLGECRTIIANAVDHPVSWQAGADLSRLRASPVALRIILRNARLYAFQFVEERG